MLGTHVGYLRMRSHGGLLVGKQLVVSMRQPSPVSFMDQEVSVESNFYVNWT